MKAKNMKLARVDDVFDEQIKDFGNEIINCFDRYTMSALLN